MARAATLMILAITLAGSAVTLRAQSLEEGVWQGTTVRQNGRTQGFSIEVRNAPDPHWRWRPSQGALATAILIRGQVRQQLIDLRVDDGLLSYSYAIDGVTTRCELAFQDGDGSYEGPCASDDDGGRGLRTTLTRQAPEN